MIFIYLYNFKVLVCFSTKRCVVPGHIGCIHVHKVNVNPEIDTKRNRLIKANIDSEQLCDPPKCLNMSIKSNKINVPLLPVRRDSQVFVQQSTQQLGVLLVVSSTDLADAVKRAESTGVSLPSKHHQLVWVDVHSNVLGYKKNTKS